MNNDSPFDFLIVNDAFLKKLEIERKKLQYMGEKKLNRVLKYMRKKRTIARRDVKRILGGGVAPHVHLQSCDQKRRYEVWG